MFGGTPDLPVLPLLQIPRLFLAVCLTAGAVKLMDDALDGERDKALGYENWATRLGRATTPYALVLALSAAAVDLQATLVLFFAAYALGMGRTPTERQPSGLPAAAEIILAAAAALYVGGIPYGVAAASQLWAIQMTDDWLDRAEDGKVGEAGAGNGKANDPGAQWLQLGVAALCTLIAFALHFWLAVACILAATVVWTLARKREVRES